MPLLRRHQYLEGRPTLVCHRRLDDDRPRRPLRGDNLTGGDRAATQRNYDSRVAMCVSHQCHRGRGRAIDLFVRVLPTNAVRLSVCPRPPAPRAVFVYMSSWQPSTHLPGRPTDRLTLRHVPIHSSAATGRQLPSFATNFSLPLPSSLQRHDDDDRTMWNTNHDDCLIMF